MQKASKCAGTKFYKNDINGMTESFEGTKEFILQVDVMFVSEKLFAF